jgi:hypothetical protein
MGAVRTWVMLGVVSVAGVLAGTTSAAADSQTFTLPADPAAQPSQRWTVPTGVCSATFDLYGAEGSRADGRGGAQVTTTLAVTPGSAYGIYVGGQGYLGRGGYNGGGAASGAGTGGGGATDVRTGPGLADRILVAGGAGGNGGGSNSGKGGNGGLTGENGTASPDDDAGDAGDAGKGASATSGGSGGTGAQAGNYAGALGTLGVGGKGGTPLNNDGDGDGGGGGGGLYGGGGGGAGTDGGAGAGGGGGSSLTAGGTVSPLAHPTDGKAIITYSISSSCSHSVGQTVSSTGDKTKPTLGGLSFSTTTFEAAKSGASIAKKHKAKVGTKVSFNLSEASSVKFTVQRKTKGRKVHGKCKTKTHSNRRKKSCTFYKSVKGAFTVAGKAGKDTFTFRGRMGGKSLKPGSYRLNGTATDPSKNASVPKQKGFKIVK